MAGRVWLACGAGVALLGVAAACRQIVGIGDGPPTDLVAATDGGPDGSVAGDARSDGADAADGGGACGLPYAGTCASCVTTSCCAVASSCANDPVCGAYASCLALSNGDPSRRAQCLIDNAIGESSTVAALENCLATSCETQCQLPCGGLVADFAAPDAALSCEKCVEANDCKNAQACAQSPDCFAFAECILACGPGFDCDEACGAAHDAGSVLFGAFRLQFSGTCAAPCSFGNYWACVGHVTQPTAEVAATAVTIQALQFGSTTGIQGLLASVCGPSDLGCSMPIDDGGTDEGGRVRLTVPQQVGNAGFDGYYRMWSPDGGVVPEIIYLSFPLRAASLFFTEYFLPPLELQLILGGNMVTQAPGRGYLALIAYDCLSVQAAGVRFSTSAPADAGVQVFYEHNAAFGHTATATDTSGVALLTNVPVGTIDVTATPSELGGRPSSTLTVNVEDGKATVVLLMPNE